MPRYLMGMQVSVARPRAMLVSIATMGPSDEFWLSLKLARALGDQRQCPLPSIPGMPFAVC